MALARASFGSFCCASEQEYWHGYHSTYCQRILTEVDCLGSVETVLATPSFTLERILSANLGYFELPQPTQSQSSCKENYGPENIEQDCSMKRWTDLLLAPHVEGCLVGLWSRRLVYGG